MSRRIVNGPDGREWVITRSREGASVFAKLSRRSRYVIDAKTAEPPAEARRWYATKLADATALVEDIALALRTGAEGPLEPEPEPGPGPEHGTGIG